MFALLPLILKNVLLFHAKKKQLWVYSFSSSNNNMFILSDLIMVVLHGFVGNVGPFRNAATPDTIEANPGSWNAEYV